MTTLAIEITNYIKKQVIINNIKTFNKSELMERFEITSIEFNLAMGTVNEAIAGETNIWRFINEDTKIELEEVYETKTYYTVSIKKLTISRLINLYIRMKSEFTDCKEKEPNSLIQILKLYNIWIKKPIKKGDEYKVEEFKRTIETLKDKSAVLCLIPLPYLID